MSSCQGDGPGALHFALANVSSGHLTSKTWEAHSPQPHQSYTSRAPARAAESPKLSLPGAAPGRLAKLLVGAWQKSDAPALQAGSNGSVTRRPPPFHRGKLDQSTERSLINFFRWV